jgi:hypothetical protein
VEYVMNLDTWHYRLNNSAVIFISHSPDIWKFTKNAKLSNYFPKNLKFLMFYDEFDGFDPVLMSYNKDEA